MKKSIIAVALILVVIAILPIAGNQYIKSSIDDRVAELQSYGLEVKEDKSVSTYLNTSRHFEFYLKDSSKFIDYLNNYSENQIPPYVNAIINGLVVGADIEYSNLPFAKSQSVEIYPLRLAPEMEASLKKNSPDFYTYLEKFLKLKGILYHINYNLINSKFDGYIKDIDESYTLRNKAELNLVLNKVVFNGKGELLAPTRLESKIKTFNLSVIEEHEQVNIFLNGFSSSSNFESQNTYISSADINSLKLVMVGLNDDMNVSIGNMRFNASSNDQGKDTELSSKVSINSMNVNSGRLAFDLKEFNMDIALDGIDKKLFEELRTLNNPQEVQMKTAELLSKGFTLNIADFSTKDITLNKVEKLGGYDMKSNIVLKADPDMLQKIQQNPMLMVKFIDMKTNLKISKKILTLLTQATPMASTIISYAKEENNSYIFEMNFADSKASINGKQLY